MFCHSRHPFISFCIFILQTWHIKFITVNIWLIFLSIIFYHCEVMQLHAETALKQIFVVGSFNKVSRFKCNKCPIHNICFTSIKFFLDAAVIIGVSRGKFSKPCFELHYYAMIKNTKSGTNRHQHSRYELILIKKWLEITFPNCTLRKKSKSLFHAVENAQ